MQIIWLCAMQTVIFGWMSFPCCSYLRPVWCPGSIYTVYNSLCLYKDTQRRCKRL